MSWLTETVRSVVKGESKAERRHRRAMKREEAALRAIGPTPTGNDLELEVGSAGETEEQRRRRLRKLSVALQNGGDIYGDLSLGKKGLLAR